MFKANRCGFWHETVKAPVSGHPPKTDKSVCNWSWPLNYGNVQIQSLYELEFKQGFVKAVVSRVAYESVRSESFNCIKIETYIITEAMSFRHKTVCQT